MRKLWPLTAFLLAAAVHHVLLGLEWYSLVSKGLLMGSLLLGVLAVGLVTDRSLLATRRARYAFLLLCGAIALSLAGDLGLAVSLEFGMLWFVLALCGYIGMAVGPARARSLPGWAIPYGLLYSPVIGILWAHLGPFGSLIAFYGLLLMAMAVTATMVGRVAALGGLVFLIAEGLLGFRMFWPESLDWFPDPWQDVTISLLYCVGQGLLAVGVLLRLRDEPRLAEERAARVAALAAD